MFYFILILVLIGLDQGVKWLVVAHMMPYSSIEIWRFVHLTFVRNTGAAFGIFEGAKVFFILFTIALIVAYIIFFCRRQGFERYRLAASLMVGGAVGNCIDRIFRGYVVDFIDLSYWPVFNIADIAVVCGTLLLAILILFGERDRKHQ